MEKNLFPPHALELLAVCACRNKAIIITLFACLCMAMAGRAQTYEGMCDSLSESSLPLVNLQVEIGNVRDTSYTPALVDITDPQCRTEGSRQSHFRCMVRYRGSSSLRYQKKSFAVKLVDENDSALDVPILGIRKSDNWILNAMAIDRIRMRDRVLFDVWNEMSAVPYSTEFEQRNGTKGHFLELFVNGQYHGLYCMTDKINRKLLGLKKAKTEDDGTVSIRGLLLKCNKWSDAAYLRGMEEESMDSTEWNGWELKYPDSLPSADSYQPLASLIDFCSTTSDAEFVGQLEEWFYPDNLVDYHLFATAFSLVDNVLKNTFLSIRNLNKGHRWLITPWDLDASMGGNWQGDHKPDLFLNYNIEANPFSRLLQIGEPYTHYFDSLKDRWLQLAQTTLSESAIAARLDSYVGQFEASGAWKREYSRWNNNPVPLTPILAEEIDYVKTWYHRSFAKLEATFGNASGIEQALGETPGATVRYNLAGQRVGLDYKGLVIDGRKKIFIK